MIKEPTVLTEVDVLVADGVAETAAGVGAAQAEDEVEREEQGRPAGTEPTREERSNKLQTIQDSFMMNLIDKLDDMYHHPPDIKS